MMSVDYSLRTDLINQISQLDNYDKRWLEQMSFENLVVVAMTVILKQQTRKDRA